jgi:chromosomal replication initiator protein
MNNLISTWNKIKEKLENEISPINFAMWIVPIEPVELTETVFTLKCSTAIIKRYFLEKFAKDVERIIEELEGRSLTLEVLVLEKVQVSPQRATQALAKKINPIAPSQFGVYFGQSESLFLKDFIAGTTNRFVLDAAKQVVEHPGKWNPFFVYGNSGVGKTRLVKSIANEYSLAGKKGRYMQGNKFYNLYFAATQNRKYDKFYSMFEKMDYLIIDDIQFFKGKLKTQETFFHIFNTLYENGVQIIITANQRPNKIEGLESALLSRLNWGLLLELENPCLEARRNIIEKLTNDIKGFTPELMDYFATLHLSTIRDIEGLVIRLRAFSEFRNIPITKHILDIEMDKILQNAAMAIRVEDVQEEVCDYFDLSMKDLMGAKRVRNIMRPRQVAMYLSKKHTTTTYPQLSLAFGRKAHSTVHNAYSKIEKMQKTDREISRAIEIIENRLKKR